MRWFLYWVLFMSGLAATGYSQEAKREFFSEYSRPNDDRFQNAAGRSGEPYEVARLRLTLTVNPNTKGQAVRLRWSSKMVTGRHVEAASHVVLRESWSSLKGETRTIEPGKRDPENIADLKIVYPKGVTVDSSVEDKIGSELWTEVELGTLEKDGEYSGELQARTRASQTGERITENADGVTHFVNQNVSVFHTVQWKVKIEGGKAVDGQVTAARPTVPQLKLVASNCLFCDSELADHQPYPKQPKAAKCKKETVGKGGADETTPLGAYEILQRRLATSIREAGCTNCHGEGSEGNFRFCDDGTPIYPKQEAHNIYSLVTNATEIDWEKYPKGMRDAVDELRTTEKETGTVSAWAFKTGVAPGLDVEFPKGVVCEYRMRFSSLNGKVLYDFATEVPKAESTFNEALEVSCRDCLEELIPKKGQLLRDGATFFSYACVLPREGCTSVHDDVRYSVGKKSLQKALAAASKKEPAVRVLCDTEG